MQEVRRRFTCPLGFELFNLARQSGNLFFPLQQLLHGF